MMKECILKQLQTIEEEYSVKIIFACEAGSRSTGLATPTSDYDVRFLYIRPIQWYLSIDKKKDDVISLPVNNQLDLVGWDLQKALFLLTKSNPTLLEWLQSSIIYLENETITNKIKEVVPYIFSVRTCFFHYLHMAKGNYKAALKDDEPSVKLYLNVLRPLLYCRWLERKQTIPSVEFEHLLDVCEQGIKSEVAALLHLKKGRLVTPNFAMLNTYIEKEFIHLEHVIKEVEDQKEDLNVNDIFLYSLEHIWQIKL
ncbi:nucleotidyltransferase domain-containing protein [Anaerobacillus alkaliphilus]|uniref:Nucleotidyltransferase domain-containing protein n=1 Tax=Anaerobacillus alkaliphilus TaxID=1548597 RepID=A0A4Q0VKK4_9BACI|nr:nucleotidyltransferase domain-containing protein [Anaerobacillus alkaliphilus]RXI95524.1 nucleotidyltransferase domain-containing protein [Anaerobacillus alkaliphilus]